VPAVRMFLDEKGGRDLLAHLTDDAFLCNTDLLADITCQLSSLNLKL